MGNLLSVSRFIKHFFVLIQMGGKVIFSAESTDICFGVNLGVNMIT